jgi:hypothetical protein
VHALPVQTEGTAVEGLEQPRDVEKCRLARSRRSGDGDELPFLHLETEITQRVRLDELGAVDLADVMHVEHGDSFVVSR